MTRRDLEETIGHLEYLSALNPPPEGKREEYEQQLQTFRVALQAMNQQPDSPTDERSRNSDSDVRLGLMYAEQELFLSLRALSAGEPLAISQQHLRWILQHERHLPGGLVGCLRGLDAAFTRREQTGARDEAGAYALATAARAALDAVRIMLGERRKAA